MNARHRQIPERILDCIKTIDEARVRNHVKSFCEIGPRCDELPYSIRNTLAYLKEALDEYGYHVQKEQSDSEYQTNVIAELPGTISKNCVFEIGAHYDTKPNTPGADDNAGGLAGPSRPKTDPNIIDIVRRTPAALPAESGDVANRSRRYTRRQMARVRREARIPAGQYERLRRHQRTTAPALNPKQSGRA
jgi:hypothetical protein